MTVFISHSFENTPEFENVADSLDHLEVPYWKPEAIKSGASLRSQLREAVNSCSVCIFVATHHSIVSSWCGAELGAFWGADIPIIVYLAEASIPEEMLPPILLGDVWDRKLSSIAKRAAELVRDRADIDIANPTISPGRKVAAMTVEQLDRIVAGAVSLVLAGEQRTGTSGTPSDNLGTTALDAAGHVLRAADATSYVEEQSDDAWRRRILWVDDYSENNTHERGVFETLGFTFDISHSTDDALDRLGLSRYGAIISDMGRAEGPREGYRLLDAVRMFDGTTPFLIYAGSNAPEHKQEAARHGAQGSTNSPTELVDMVVEALRFSESTST